MALVALASCSDPVGDDIDLLGSASVARRAQLTTRLVKAARSQPRERERVADALSSAYRVDVGREHLVAGLAALDAHGGGAEAVYLSALADFARGPSYSRAAVHAARALGEHGAGGNAARTRSALLAALRSVRQRAAPRWGTSSPPRALTRLARVIVSSLARAGSGDRAAVAAALLELVKAGPLAAPIALQRHAIDALATLRAANAVDRLVALCGATAHGRLLRERARGALCAIGPPALRRLLTLRRSARLEIARVAAGLLADLATSTEQLGARGGDDAEVAFELVVARARRGDVGALQALLSVAQAPAASGAQTTRRLRAIEVAGELARSGAPGAKAARTAQRLASLAADKDADVATRWSAARAARSAKTAPRARDTEARWRDELAVLERGGASAAAAARARSVARALHKALQSAAGRWISPALGTRSRCLALRLSRSAAPEGTTR